MDPPVEPPGQPIAPPVGCATTDPFINIPGLAGICQQGGWFPTQLLTAEGTVRFRSDDDGLWIIEMDDGRVFVLMNVLPVEFQSEGLRVTFTAKMRPDLASALGSVVEIIAIQ